MIDGVIGAAFSNFHEQHAQRAGQRLELSLVACHADKVAMKVMHVLRELCRLVPFRVDRHEHHLTLCVIGRRFLKNGVDLGKQIQGSRTDVGTMGETEEHQGPLAAQIREFERRAIVAGEIHRRHLRRIGPQQAVDRRSIVATVMPIGQADAGREGHTDDEHHRQPGNFWGRGLHASIISITTGVVASYASSLALQMRLPIDTMSFDSHASHSLAAPRGVPARRQP